MSRAPIARNSLTLPIATQSGSIQCGANGAAPTVEQIVAEQRLRSLAAFIISIRHRQLGLWTRGRFRCGLRSKHRMVSAPPPRKPINLPGFAPAPDPPNDPKLATRPSAARVLKSAGGTGLYYPAHFPPKSSNTLCRLHNFRNDREAPRMLRRPLRIALEDRCYSQAIC